MKKFKSHNNTWDGEAIQLQKLHNALKFPQAANSKRYLELLSSAPASSVDNLLCKISSRARKCRQSSSSTSSNSDLGKMASDEWPLHRLLICFDAVLGHLKHRSCQNDLLPLPSFKACVRLVLDVLPEGMAGNDDCVIYAVTKLNGAKCWYKLMEHMAKLTRRATPTTKTAEIGLVRAILKDIRSRQTHLHTLTWVTDVSENDMSPHLLHSTFQQTLMRARCYALRGLLMQSPFFGLDLILHDAYRRLLFKPLFFYFGQGSTHSTHDTSPALVKTTTGKRRRLQHQQQPHDDSTYLLSMCTYASQLLDALCKVEMDQKDIFRSEQRQYTWEMFIQSSASHSDILARTWTGAILNLLHVVDDTATSSQQQNNSNVDMGRLFYCLTTVLMKLPPDSDVFIHLGPPLSYQQRNTSNTLSTTSWFRVLPLFCAQFVYYVQQPRIEELGGIISNSKKSTKTNLLKSVYTMDVLRKLLTRLCHVSWRCLVLVLDKKRQSIDKKDDLDLQQFGAKMMGCLTNFLLAFTAFPVSVEALVTMALGDGYGGITTSGGGRDMNSNLSPTLLSMDLCADVVIRGYFGLTSGIIEESQDFLGPLLETMMQYIQVVSNTWRLEIGPRIAWCLRSQMALLYGDEKLDDSPLLPKFQKLVVYLLHDDGAIHQMAESSTGLGKYIWEPTILQAHDGLKVAAALATVSGVESVSSPSITSPENMQALVKSKRALMALEQISRHTRACERLAETSILNLIDTTLIPCIWSATSPSDQRHLEAKEVGGDLLLCAPIQIWSVYGLLVRLLASLAERTSLMRSKLLQERQLVNVIMGLLWCTLQCQSTLYADFCQQDQNEKIRERIVTCQHVVVASLRVVYAYRYDKSAILEWVSWKQCDDRGRTLTLVFALVCILVPWYNNDMGNEATGDDNGNRYQWMVFSNQMTSALELLEHIVYLDECGKQLIQDDDRALHGLSRWLVTLSTLLNPSDDRLYTPTHNYGGFEEVQTLDDDNIGATLAADDDDIWQNQLDLDGESRYDANTREIQLDTRDNDGQHEQFDTIGASDDLLATLLYHSATNTGQQSNNGSYSLTNPGDYSVAMSTTTARIKNVFVTLLVRVLTKLITTNASLKIMILTDGFTRLFGPMMTMTQTLTAEQKVDNSLTWSIAIQLGEALWKKVDDLERLFEFFGQNDDDINHRHELTAVALAYASFWKTEHWHSVLGLFGFDTGKESIVYSTGPFGILCHMLMLNGNGQLGDDHITPGDSTDTLSKKTKRVGNDAKRYAAAQALSILTHSSQAAWRKQLDEALEDNHQQLQQLLSQHFVDSTFDGPGNHLLIRTDDVSTPLHVNTRDLIWISPAFNAMLSDHYSEATTDSIYLHEITMTSLQHFIYVSQSLQKYCVEKSETITIGCETILDELPGDGWDAIVTLIHMADRYGSRLVQMLGERWIMGKIKRQQSGYLGGCMFTYRHLRDKHGVLDGGGLTGDSWPFYGILNQCIKAILLDLVGLIETTSFKELLQIDNNNANLDDIESFCNAALVIYQQMPP